MSNHFTTGFGIVIACAGIFVATACSSAAPASGDGTSADNTTPAPSSTTGTSSGGANGTNGSNGSSASNGTSTAGTSGTNGSGGTNGANGANGSTDDDGGVSADNACGVMATDDACYTCCETNHPSGSTIYDAAWTTCMCGATGACQTQCATSDCSNDPNAPLPTPGDACDLCEQAAAPGDGTGKCDAPIAKACDVDADCVALSACYDTCP
jgi:hypothetical protein